MTIDFFTEFLGWVSILTISYLMLSTVLIISLKGMMLSIHSKLFGLDKKVIELKYFEFLSNFKVFTMIFVVLPYFSLKIMG